MRGLACAVVIVAFAPAIASAQKSEFAFSIGYSHLSLDGARGAQFLTTLAELVEEPLALLT